MLMIMIQIQVVDTITHLNYSILLESSSSLLIFNDKSTTLVVPLYLQNLDILLQKLLQ